MTNRPSQPTPPPKSRAVSLSGGALSHTEAGGKKDPVRVGGAGKKIEPMGSGGYGVRAELSWLWASEAEAVQELRRAMRGRRAARVSVAAMLAVLS